MPEAWVKERKDEKRAYIEFIPEKVDSWDNGKLWRAVGPGGVDEGVIGIGGPTILLV